LTPDELAFIEENVPVVKKRKGDFLIEEGEVATAFHFIVKGAVRLYYTVQLEEKTAFFYFENDFVSAYESYTKQLPAKHTIQCIEACDLAVINRSVAFTLLERFPKFEFLARIAMEKELSVCQDIIASFITLSPEERYLKLMKEAPEWLSRVPQYYLASYIGVRPESLSRIRKRIVS
jgi:CRP-like cAMP-binding protein